MNKQCIPGMLQTGNTQVKLCLGGFLVETELVAVYSCENLSASWLVEGILRNT